MPGSIPHAPCPRPGPPVLLFEGATSIRMNEPAIGFDVSTVMAGLMLIPYLVWGVYVLSHQLRDHADFPVLVETLTIAGLIVFFLFEMTLLRMWLGPSPLWLFTATAGLIVSCAALYGPLLFSFTSHAIVNIVMPHGQKRVQGPEYGPSEGLERSGLFEDAGSSYAALARAFPKESTPALRAADNFMKIGDTEQAAEWFEKGLANLMTAKQAMPVAFRLFEIYSRMLNDDESARVVLETFLERFPESEQSAAAQKRLDRLNRKDNGDPQPHSPPLQFEHD